MLKEQKEDVLIYRIIGKFDAVTSPDIEEEILKTISSHHQKILFDFSKVNYMSSAGVRVLFSIIKKIQETSGKVILCSLTPNVWDIIRLTNLHAFLDIAESEEQALSWFQKK